MIDFVALQTALAGQYFLERELGRGGMGVVYLAREVRLDRPVAIKVLPPALAAQAHLRERFLREARTAAGLAHPHVVPVHRVEEGDGFVYLAMGYVDGGTLAERLRARGGSLPAAEVVRLVREVGWALAYAHARGVVHRDVKPDNILLDRESGRALVTDFGIAHVSDVAPADRLTGEGLVMGTALYMSPEQAAGEPIDGRSDLYALGVVAYLALAGRPPFEAGSAHALLAKHLTQEPPPLPGTVPPRLARVVRQCLAKRPDERPPTGEVLAELLDAAMPAERALPAPLRRWAEGGDPLFPLYALWIAGMAAVVGVNLIVGLFAELPSGEIRSFVVLMLVPLVPLTIRTLTRTAAVMREGYGIEDLRAAARHQRDRARADQAQERSPVPRWAARLLQLLAYGLAVAFAGATLVFLTTVLPETSTTEPRQRAELQRLLDWMGWLFLAAAGANLLGNAFGVTWPTHAGRGALDALRCRFWESGAGAWLVERLGRGRALPAAYVERPTERAIGLAAGELYATLPAAVRRRLEALPPLLRRLEEEAEGMRERADVLGQHLAELESGARGGTAAGAAPETPTAERRAIVRGELRTAREQALARRGAAVATLETLRLDLLRLHGDAAPAVLDELVARVRRGVAAPPTSEGRTAPLGAAPLSDAPTTPAPGSATART